MKRTGNEEEIAVFTVFDRPYTCAPTYRVLWATRTLPVGAVIRGTDIKRGCVFVSISGVSPDTERKILDLDSEQPGLGSMAQERTRVIETLRTPDGVE